MIYIGRWTTIIVLGILLMGLVFTLPNFLGQQTRAALPRILPNSTINLGLDLQGGSYLLLEVDMPGVVKERMQSLRGDIRAALRKERVNFDNLNLGRDSLTVHVIDAAQLDAARKVLRDIASPPGTFLGLG